MPKVEDLGNYLGIPTIWGRSKRNTLAYVKDRVMDKLHGWKQQFLSHAGKEILIKGVAQAVLSYLMNIFKLPDNLCNEIGSSSVLVGPKGERKKNSLGQLRGYGVRQSMRVVWGSEFEGV